MEPIHDLYLPASNRLMRAYYAQCLSYHDLDQAIGFLLHFGTIPYELDLFLIHFGF